MICTVIQGKNFGQIDAILPYCEMAEIRLDRCELTMDEIGLIFSSDVPLVATCRVDEVMKGQSLSREEAETVCEERLVAAIKAGAMFVDVELEVSAEMAERVKSAAVEFGTTVIRSYHDFEGTDSQLGLKALAEKCFNNGAEVAKIVTMAKTQADVDRVMSLYDEFKDEYLIAFCMGEAGRQSRVECLRRGALYTYAALSEEAAAAPGQWAMSDIMTEVYGDRSFFGGNLPDFSESVETDEDDDELEDEEEVGAVRMPSSKSFAQRAIVLAALADGVSHLKGYTPCADSEAAIAVAKALGAKVTVKQNDDTYTLTIRGVGARTGSLKLAELNVGESGLLTRMMIPLVARLCGDNVTLTGEKTLLNRPLAGACEMMSHFGVQLSSEKVPLTVSGNLTEGKAEISGKYGSQLISGLLMAQALGETTSTIDVKDPKSIPYMFITTDVMNDFGVRVSSQMSGGQDFLDSDEDWSLCTEISFRVRGGQSYKATDLVLEGDWSAAANFLVAGAVFGRVEIEGLDTSSLQADLSIMDILMDAGASLSQLDDDKGLVVAQRAPLTAFQTDASNCPDLFPIVAVLAAFCQGKSEIKGVDRLAHKESDRAAAILQMLTQMGVEAEIKDNTLFVQGHSLVQRLLTGTLLKGGDYTSHHDHRMVMALKVASLGASSPVVIDDVECVEKSFPLFFDIFAAAKE